MTLVTSGSLTNEDIQALATQGFQVNFGTRAEELRRRLEVDGLLDYIRAYLDDFGFEPPWLEYL